MSRYSNRRKRINLLKQEITTKYDTKDESVWQIVLRVLRKGPEMVGTEILTQSQAYFMLWTMIFNQHIKDNKFPKK